MVLPDHMHAVWTLPEKDGDYSFRWREIKKRFSKALPNIERRSQVRILKGERGIWQRRFWEHTICDERDYRYPVGYVYFNPVKYGLVKSVIDWPYSSFYRDATNGLYSADWCSDQNSDNTKEKHREYT